jgi:RNA polymerase sigma factor (sigma-70 family)
MTKNLNTAYADYTTEVTADTLNDLLKAVTRYADGLAKWKKHPSPDDIAQDVAVKVWTSLGTFNSKSTFTTWVHQITCRVILDDHRSSRREPLTQMDELPESASDGERTPSRSIIPVHLPPASRVMLDALDSTRNFVATASQLGITPKALRSRLERMKK